ncbi:MAG: recombinase family protein [Taibaiella sp.]|nr:recombinase family protein [Taibaiella sp.]
MQQKMLFLFGEFDNHLRKQKCMDGIRDMLLRGDWPTSPPIGFDVLRSNGKRCIIVNQKGKLIRLAFNWKANEGVTNEEIRIRLANRGLKVGHQKISDIFRNPFYCGMMAHKMLNGEVIKGNQEELISKETFLKVNGILNKNTHGYSIVEENEQIPLKRFMHCDTCAKPMRGYLVRNKNIHYYKCNTKGCCNNKNAESLHNTFKEILNHFSLQDSSESLKQLIRKQATATFNQLNEDSGEDYKQLELQHKEVSQKLLRLEERFIEEEINKDLYERYSEKYSLEKKEIEKNLKNQVQRVSNLEEYVDLATEFASKMASGWDSSDYITKQAIQNLIFPEGMYYNKKKNKCRTTRVNILFSYIAHYKEIISKKERGISELPLEYASFACLVARAGIEPTTFGL